MKNQASDTSRCWISTSRRWQLHLLERRDVGSQHRDVGSQRRDVSFTTLWNIATLDLNVATSVSPLSRTSRCWIQRRDVEFIASLSCRDVGSQRRDVGSSTFGNVVTLSPNIATLPLFYAQRPLFLSYPRIASSESSRTSIVADLRPPCRLYHHRSLSTPTGSPHLSRVSITPSVTLVWCPTPVPIGS